MGAMRKGLSVASYALADLRSEPVVAACSALLFTTIIVPVLLLFVVKFGVVTAMADRLAADPRSTELIVIGEQRIDADLEAEIMGLPGVGFAMVTPRFLTGTQSWWRSTPERGPRADIDLIPTSPGDPAFEPGQSVPARSDEVALSAGAADTLGVAVGDGVTVTLRRVHRGGRMEVQRPAFTVTAIVPATRWRRDTVFVTPLIARAIEEYAEFTVDPDTMPDWPARLVDPDAPGAGLRIHARSIREAPALAEGLANLGIHAQVREGEIDALLRLERGLDRLFAGIMAVAALGFGLAAFLTQWLGVERKRREIALLMLSGFRRHTLVLFPLVQTIMTVLFGIGLSALALVLAHPVMASFVADHAEGATLRYPAVSAFVAMAGAACLVATTGCLGAVGRLAALNVSEALRDD